MKISRWLIHILDPLHVFAAIAITAGIARCTSVEAAMAAYRAGTLQAGGEPSACDHGHGDHEAGHGCTH